MTAWHWIILAAAVGTAALWLLLTWRRPRIRASDAEELPSVRGQYPPPDDDDFDDWTRQALDVIAEPDRRRGEHMNRTLRRVEGGGAGVVEALQFIGQRHGGTGDPLASTCACLQGKPCLCPCHQEGGDEHG